MFRRIWLLVLRHLLAQERREDAAEYSRALERGDHGQASESLQALVNMDKKIADLESKLAQRT